MSLGAADWVYCVLVQGAGSWVHEQEVLGTGCVLFQGAGSWVHELEVLGTGCAIFEVLRTGCMSWRC